jgi:hypothetical protein
LDAGHTWRDAIDRRLVNVHLNTRKQKGKVRNSGGLQSDGKWSKFPTDDLFPRTGMPFEKLEGHLKRSG